MPVPDLATRERLGKVAAAQETTASPTRTIVERSRGQTGASDPNYLRNLDEWQSYAIRYSQELGIVRFAATLKADTASRVAWQVQRQRPDGEWEEAADFNDLLDLEHNPRQESTELTRLRAWHYEIAGEMFLVVTDGQGGETDWWIYGKSAVSFKGDTATIKETPNGSERDGTAYTIPRSQVRRLWVPDEEWPGLATSPMRASIDALRRYSTLSQYATLTAKSRMLMAGALWTPAEAHERKSPTDPTISELDDAFVKLAQRKFREGEERVAAVAPFNFHYRTDLAKPEYVEFGHGLDPEGIAYRQEAIEDFARSTNLPVKVLTGEDANHWSEWMFEERTFKNGVGPLCDRVAADRTITFLRPMLMAAHGMTVEQADEYRVGYDPANVIVPQDQSDVSLRAYQAGLLDAESALEACGLDPDDYMTDELQRAWLLEVASKGASSTTVNMPGVGPPGAPAGPRDMPSTGPAPPVAVPVPQAASTTPTNGHGGLGGRVAARKLSATEQQNRALKRIAEIRRSTAKELLAAGEAAFAGVLLHAGRKIAVAARNRGSLPEPTRQTYIAQAEALDRPLRPVVAAVGVREAELLGVGFAGFQTTAAALLKRQQAREREALRKADYDPDRFMPPEDDDRKAGAGAAFLTAALTALAFGRLMDGPKKPEPGEISGNVPGRFGMDAVRISAGVAVATPGTIDQVPDVVPLADAPSLARQLGAERTTYVWRTGDPDRPFEPHQELDGYETATPDGDPNLYNSESWPDVPLYFPGDHVGCQCSWEEHAAEIPAEVASVT